MCFNFWHYIYIEKIKKQSTFIFVACVIIYVCILLNCTSFRDASMNYNINISQADIFINFLSGSVIYLIIIPIISFINLITLNTYENPIFIIRFNKKSNFWKMKYIDLIFNTLFFSVFIFLCIGFISLLFNPNQIINWNNSSSLYSIECGFTNLKINFLTVVLLSFIFLYITILFTSVLIQIVEFKLNSMYSLIILVIYCWLQMKISNPFNDFNYRTFNNIPKFLIIQLSKCIVMITLYFIGLKIARRKDIFNA